MQPNDWVTAVNSVVSTFGDAAKVVIPVILAAMSIPMLFRFVSSKIRSIAK